MSVELNEVFDALAAIDQVRLEAAGGMVSIADLSEMVLPEFTDDDRSNLEYAVLVQAVERLAGGMTSNQTLVEAFLRGVEMGREVERRIK